MNLDYFVSVLHGKDGDKDVLCLMDMTGDLLNFEGEDRRAILEFLENEASHGFVTKLVAKLVKK